MALSIDSRAVLRAIVDNPSAFPVVQVDLDEFARKMLVKQMKHKDVDLKCMRAIYSAAGRQAFTTILDSMTTNELASVLKKIDLHNIQVKGGDAGAIRATINDLVSGLSDPSAKPDKPTKSLTSKKTRETASAPKIGKLLGSEVHSGVRPKPFKAPSKK